MSDFFAQTEELLSDFAGAPLRVLRVANLEQFVDRDALLADGRAPEPPYWAHLWPAARALARLVADSSAPRSGQRVIEIGCGLGLPGLVIARTGASVIFSDRNRDALRFAAASLERNGLAGLMLAMNWRFPSIRCRFDLCLAADVTYDPGSHQSLVEFLDAHLELNGEAWIAESVRTEEKRLPELLRARFAVGEQRMPEIEDGRRVWVRVLRASRRR
ncbi:MAG TPA: methyltransferase [Candidatus Kryptonia bacterium]|nr:methyltransferase [Candidatus Kryptonia bacterium]